MSRSAAQKDVIENSKREAADEANHLRDVIAGPGQQLQASQDQLQQTTNVESRMGDAIVEEMPEAGEQLGWCDASE